MSKTPIKTQSQPKENFRIRSQQNIVHHLFKAAVAVCKKNLSWKWAVLDLKDVEHVHFFHNVNSHGMPQKFTNMVAGHFHEIKWSVDADGNPVAECGPALHKKTRRTPVGQKTSTEIVAWETHNDSGEKISIQDKHTHVMEYQGTDVLSREQVNRKAIFIPPEMPATLDNEEISMVPATTPRDSK